MNPEQRAVAREQALFSEAADRLVDASRWVADDRAADGEPSPAALRCLADSAVDLSLAAGNLAAAIEADIANRPQVRRIRELLRSLPEVRDPEAVTA